MPSKVVAHLLGDDLARFGHGTAQVAPLTKKTFEALLAETRKHGLSRTRGRPIPGIDALCAPVFDSAGHIVLGILVMGPSATFDSAWDGAVAKGLRRSVSEISRRLGQTGNGQTQELPLRPTATSGMSRSAQNHLKKR
jgi:DNA-binding IclR family transcriptional regulator